LQAKIHYYGNRNKSTKSEEVSSRAAARKKKAAEDAAKLAAAKKKISDDLKKANVDLNDKKFVAKNVTKTKPKENKKRVTTSATQLNFGGTRLGSVTKLNRKKGRKSYRA